jgi:molecular chaperone DnaK
VLVDVTPLTLNVETIGGYCDPLIARNTPVPCRKTRTFVTVSDSQSTVLVKVGQGEAKQFDANTLLGQLELTGLRPAPRGDVAIAVTFVMNTDGILEVEARDVATGREAKARVRLVGLPEEGEVAALAARHARRSVA